MHPLKPYFLGSGAPSGTAADELPEGLPHGRPRVVGTTARHLTFFEMLGNFSFGDYFKTRGGRVRMGALARGLRLRRGGHLDHGLRGRRGARPRSRRGGDRGLAGASACRASGSSRARAARTSGRPARPGPAGRARSSTSTAASTTVRPRISPAARTPASSNTGTSSSCSTTSSRPTRSTPLPARNIDTGLGLNRMAAILQDVADGVRDRPVQAADRAGRGAVRAALRDRRAPRPQPARARRPRARDDLPGRRRRRAVQHRARLCAAARDAPRRAAWALAWLRAGIPRRATANWCAS